MTNFTGKEQQDLFAYYLLGGSSTFLDVGCYHPIQWNNTFALESLGWAGLLVDIEKKWVDLCNSNRKSKAILCDVSKQSFTKNLEDNWPTKHFGYVSMDADSGNVSAVMSYLSAGFTFDVMTYEHDSYQFGNERKGPAKQALEKSGYVLLFEDVKCTDDNLPWEDWWVNPKTFDDNLLRLRTSDKHHKECLKIIKKHIVER